MVEITDVNSAMFKYNIDVVKSLISKADKISVLSGAGVSTASGISDFRGANGIYNQESKYEYSPEEILNIDFFTDEDKYKKIFWEFYRNTFLGDYEPNIVHKFLADLESKGKEVYISTQNIDGLHERVGSSIVYDIHGNASRFKCMCCDKDFNMAWFRHCEDEIPVHKDCRKVIGEETPYIRPDIVLYGENLDTELLNSANKSAEDADLYFAIGTSLYVGPANSLPFKFLKHNKYYKEDAYLVIINKGDLSEHALNQYKRACNRIIYFNCDMLDVINALKD